MTLYMTANRVGLSFRETANCSLPVSLKLGHHRALVPSPGTSTAPSSSRNTKSKLIFAQAWLLQKGATCTHWPIPTST